MKIIYMILITLLTVSCNNEENVTDLFLKSTNTEVFGDKQWKLTSIQTEPAILDINGDGVKEQELISSLQDNEREKTLRFAPDGQVWEDKGGNVRSCGRWSVAGTKITWVHNDGVLLQTSPQDFGGQEIRFHSTLDEIKVTYTLTAL